MGSAENFMVVPEHTLQTQNEQDKKLPLVVDLDGTLIKTDLLLESVVRLLRGNPLYVFMLGIWLLRGKQVLKLEIARRVKLDAALLPYQQEFLEFLTFQHAQGRVLVLATASDASFALAVAQHLGIFSEVLASDARINLAGKNKAALLIEKFGSQGFDYAGNAAPDLKIWPSSRAALLVNPHLGVEGKARACSKVSHVFSEQKSLAKLFMRAIRVHQWLKNLLVFVPLLAAHAWFDPVSVKNAVLAFFAFSLCASSIYLVNDLLDLDSDRAHARKKNRPLAAGDMSLFTAVWLTPLLLGLGLVLAALVSIPFVLSLLVYVAITSVYSFYLKAFVLIDVLLLGILYTLRVIAGAVAIAVIPSFWLLALSMLLFISLALIKRCAELVSLKNQGRQFVKGRDYQVEDLAQLTGLGTAAANGAVVILALYINSPDIEQHYHHPKLLWLLCPIVLYWIGRMWIKTGRGEMHDDPIVYSAKDKLSLSIASMCALLVFFAI